MKILIDKMTDKVVGVNLSPTPLLYEVNVTEDFNMTKTIKVQDGEIQKTSEHSVPLFKNPLYKTIQNPIAFWNEETIEETDKPSYETVQNINEEGKLLYYEPIYKEGRKVIDYTTETDAEGNIIYTPVYEEYEYIEGYEESIDAVDIYDNPNQPIMEYVQKKNENGELLYIKSMVQYEDLVIEDGFEEVEYDKIILRTKIVQVPIKTIEMIETIDELTGETIEIPTEIETIVDVEEPVEWIDLEPVMIPNMVDKSINLIDNPIEFDANEVLTQKYTDILNASNKSNIVADVFISANDLNLENENHTANVGIGFIELLPYGECKTKSIQLEKSTKVFEVLEFDADNGVKLLVNDIEFVDSKVILYEAVENIEIKFINVSDKKQTLKTYALGY